MSKSAVSLSCCQVQHSLSISSGSVACPAVFIINVKCAKLGAGNWAWCGPENCWARVFIGVLVCLEEALHVCIRKGSQHVFNKFACMPDITNMHVGMCPQGPFILRLTRYGLLSTVLFLRQRCRRSKPVWQRRWRSFPRDLRWCCFPFGF